MRLHLTGRPGTCVWTPADLCTGILWVQHSRLAVSRIYSILICRRQKTRHLKKFGIEIDRLCHMRHLVQKSHYITSRWPFPVQLLVDLSPVRMRQQQPSLCFDLTLWLARHKPAAKGRCTVAVCVLSIDHSHYNYCYIW